VASVLLDTGPLVALFKRNDHHHVRAVESHKRNRHRLLTTLPVITDAWHLVAPAAQLKLTAFSALALNVVDLGEDALDRIHDLVSQYRDRPMDFADASLVVLAERVGVLAIATIDVNGFTAFRSLSGKRFRLVF
jgi:predicted nucleic acid-binding protein